MIKIMPEILIAAYYMLGVVLSSLSLVVLTTRWDTVCYYPHFTEEEFEG